MTVRLTDGEKRALAARLLRLARELRRTESIVGQDDRASRQLNNALCWLSNACDRLVGAIVFDHEQEDPDAPYP
jgi:hypothetical protein